MSVLIRSFTDPRSFTPQNFPHGVLPRTSVESHVPWALMTDRRVDPGAYACSLPQSFLGFMQRYAAWRTDDYDIVELAATHWRPNAGALPSRLSRQLTPS